MLHRSWTPAALRTRHSAVAPLWARCRFARSAEHLGVAIGPEAHLVHWVYSCAKFHDRAVTLAHVLTGLAGTLFLYNLMAFSTITHRLQFADPDDTLKRLEPRVIAKILHTPFAAISATMLSNLKVMQAAIEASSLSTVSMISKCRLWMKCAIREDLLRAVSTIGDDPEALFVDPFPLWSQSSIVKVVHDACISCLPNFSGPSRLNPVLSSARSSSTFAGMLLITKVTRFSPICVRSPCGDCG